MSFLLPSPADMPASPHTAPKADRATAHARLSAALEAILLALLASLIGRRTLILCHAHPVALVAPAPPCHRTESPHRTPAIGRAPHADAIALHRFPDWILPGAPARGMRPTPAPRPPRPRARPARAPPPRPRPQPAHRTPLEG